MTEDKLYTRALRMNTKGTTPNQQAYKYSFY